MKRAVLIVTGFLACPCHLPIWLLILGGTTLGGFFTTHQGWALIGMTGYFAGALGIVAMNASGSLRNGGTDDSQRTIRHSR